MTRGERHSDSASRRAGEGAGERRPARPRPRGAAVWLRAPAAGAGTARALVSCEYLQCGFSLQIHELSIYRMHDTTSVAERTMKICYRNASNSAPKCGLRSLTQPPSMTSKGQRSEPQQPPDDRLTLSSLALVT